ncbi:MAG: RNA polymerase sigma factor [Ktedonobacterales bacterium]
MAQKAGVSGARRAGRLAMAEIPRDGERSSGSENAEADARDRFIALLPDHADALLRVAAALVGTADAEDAAQEAILRAWQAWPTLRDQGAVRSWLLRITVNVCRDWRRGRFGTRQRLTESLSTSVYEGAEVEATFATPGADPGASDHAAALDLRSAIGTLDDDLRVVVTLRYYAGMDATMVGAALGIPPTTVRTRLRRALALLRDRLGQPTALSAALDPPPDAPNRSSASPQPPEQQGRR